MTKQVSGLMFKEVGGVRTFVLPTPRPADGDVIYFSADGITYHRCRVEIGPDAESGDELWAWYVLPTGGTGTIVIGPEVIRMPLGSTQYDLMDEGVVVAKLNVVG